MNKCTHSSWININSTVIRGDEISIEETGNLKCSNCGYINEHHSYKGPFFADFLDIDEILQNNKP